jgi:4'-phosphopantetheinyl transferase
VRPHGTKNMPATVYWTLVGATPISLEKNSGFLSPAEQEKLASLRFAKRRYEWLLGRWAAKSLVHSLRQYHGYSMAAIEIGHAPAGAPCISLPDGSISPDCLSISHRDGLALCAVTTGRDLRIGADLEKIEARADNFLKDYFTTAENGWVESLPPETRDLHQTLIWSAKEAMLKALGVGLRWDTRQVEVRATQGGESLPGEWQELRVATPHEDHNWSAWWQRRGDHILTMAGFGPRPIRLRMLERKFYIY